MAVTILKRFPGVSKDNILLIHTNCDSCEANMKVNLHQISTIIESDNYNTSLLIDLMAKSQLEYINYSMHISKVSDNNYQELLETNLINTIPLELPIIYNNYLICINLIRKDLNHICTTLKSNINDIIRYRSEFMHLIKESDILNNHINTTYQFF